MHLDLVPRRVVALPGMPSELVVTITNTSGLIGGYGIRVLGADPTWVQIDDPEPRLFPGASVTTRLRLTLPGDLPAGDRRLSVQVTDLADASTVVVEDVVVEVPTRVRTRVVLDPPIVTAGASAQFAAIVHNEGNTVLVGSLAARDPEAKTEFRFAPAQLRVAPGQSAPVALTARARRPWFGDPVLRPFELLMTAPAEPAPQQVAAAQGPVPASPFASSTQLAPVANGVFVQKPRFTRGMISLVGLLLAITVFAAVITIALSSVVNRSAADRDLAMQVAQARGQSATTGTSTLAGSVIELSTGAPLSGVSVEAFAPDDTAQALLSVATGDDGTFTLSRLPAGDFVLRVRGAGFAEVWYPAAPSAGDATPVSVTAGQTVGDLVVVAGGVPATISGTVIGVDTAGALVRVEMPLDTAPLDGQVLPESGEAPATVGTGAVVRTVPVGADGTFEIVDVPSPAVYDLVVTKVGYATASQRTDVAAGESRTGIELPLLVGDGSISGEVVGADGPVGGASVVATSGQVRVETVSLTQDAVGTFTLRGLPTPGVHTLVVAAPGYATATLTLTLTEGQQLTGVSVVLGRDQGTLAGTVTVPSSDGGGVTVTISDGATTLQTVTRSTAPVGAWRLAGLSVPGTYTVTFSRADLESQVLSVSLDGFGRPTSGAVAADRLDVTMRAANARLSGTVSQSRGNAAPEPAGNVAVTVRSGTVERTVTTASTPTADVGRYVVENLPPGTYTVTFSRTGTRTTSQIVVLGPDERRTLSPVLVAPARVSGVVTAANGPLAGRAVLLYRAAEYGTAAGPLASATTDGNGAYRFEDVDAPQNYILEVRTVAGGSILGASAPFTVTASEDRTVSIAVAGTP